MRSAHSFIAERALANHCPELLSGKGCAESSRDELRKDLAETLSTQLSKRLQPFLAGKPLRVMSEGTGAATAGSLLQSIGSRAANFMLECGPASTPFLVSFDLRTACALTDRLFGGDGRLDGDEVDELQQSSLLALEKFTIATAQAISASCFTSDHAKVARHHTNVARLEPFPRGDYCLSWKLMVEQEGSESWHMQLAAREADIDALLTARGSANSRRKSTAIHDPSAEPFGAIPLPLRAVLAEFNLPLARLATLAPGQELPFAMPREVPIKIGERTFAKGSVGALDDRIVLRLVNHKNEVSGS